MENFFLVVTFFLLGVVMANAQNDMASMGASAGCQDGQNAAFSNSDYAYNSIMDNGSINQEYKDAYKSTYFSCKSSAKAEASNKWKFSKSSSANKKRWKTYVWDGKINMK